MKRHIAGAWMALLMGLTAHAHADNFSLSSPTFNPMTTLPQAHVLSGFGCSGGNRSPALSWQHAPEGIKSFAITLYDPDCNGVFKTDQQCALNFDQGDSSLVVGTAVNKSIVILFNQWSGLQH